MYTLQNAEHLEMTKQLANYVSTLEPVPGERKISPTRIRFLKEEIITDRMTAFRWVIATIGGDLQKTFRINGQHTSHIFASTDVGGCGWKVCNWENKPYNVILERYVCYSMEGVIALWSRFDVSNSARTHGDVFRSTFEFDEDLKSLPKYILNKGTQALSHLKWGRADLAKLPHHDRATVAVQQKDFLLWLYQTMSSGDDYRKVGIYLAAAVMFKENKDRAATFWGEVQSGTNPDPYSGSRALQRVILSHGAKSSSGRTEKRLNWNTLAELSLSAWGSWKLGKQVKQLKLTKAGLARLLPLEYAIKYRSPDQS